MKKTLSILAITFSLFAGNAYAADTIALREAAINRYLQIVPTEKLLQDAFTDIAKQLPPAQRKEFLEKSLASIDVAKVEKTTKEAMLKTFTADEINALADFYSSPHGTSAMKKFGQYMARVAPALEDEIRFALRSNQQE